MESGLAITDLVECGLARSEWLTPYCYPERGSETRLHIPDAGDGGQDTAGDIGDTSMDGTDGADDMSVDGADDTDDTGMDDMDETGMMVPMPWTVWDRPVRMTWTMQ